ncbi:MAG: hypothetical protein WD076_06145 [Parvularculaceae bacterium]
MGLTFILIALCLLVAGLGAFAMRRPALLPRIGESLKGAELKQFSPKKTLFIIGPTVNHPACRLQRRLLKPAIAALIREDVAVMEVYGDERPRKNGEEIDWLDAALLRHALDAEDGFYVVYIDDDGKSVLRSQAPVVTADLLDRANLFITSSRGSKRASAVLKRLRAA